MFCSFLQLMERNVTFIYAKKIHTEKNCFKELEFYLYGIIINHFSERKREKIGCSPWWDPSLADGSCRSPSPLCPPWRVGTERTVIMWQEPVSPCRLEKAIILVFTQKKSKTSLCSCWASETLFLLLCIAVFSMCSFDTDWESRLVAQHLSTCHSISSGPKQTEGPGCRCERRVLVNVGARAQSPGSIPPPPDPCDSREEVHSGRSRALVHVWVVSEEKPQRWAPFCTMEGTFALPSLLQM